MKAINYQLVTSQKQGQGQVIRKAIVTGMW